MGERDGYLLDEDTPVLASRAINIQQEYRIWIVEGRVVTGSLYKLDRQVRHNAMVDEDVLRYAQERASAWGPADAYVLDVARTPTGLYIIEAGNINSAGFYEADMAKLVAALEDYAEGRKP